MNGIKFFDVIRLSDEEKHNLKLMFNSDWNYIKEDNPEEVRAKLGESQYLDLLELYREGNVRLIMDSVRTHNPKKRRFKNGDTVFCFIPFGIETWLLVNVYKVLDDSKFLVDADEKCMTKFEPFLGRLVVEYKEKSRSIGLRDIDKINEKIEVKEILPYPYYKLGLDFPGYDKVRVSFTELESELKNSVKWQERLKAVKGVYLITDKSNGKLYVGSASGEDGIYGRFRTYIDKGYDKDEVEKGEYPNKKFQELVEKKDKKYLRDNFQYSILETFTLDTDRNEIIAREQYWKRILKSKEFGYNAN